MKMFIIGCGGFGREVAGILCDKFVIIDRYANHNNEIENNELFFITNEKEKHGTEINEIPVVGDIDVLKECKDNDNTGVFIAIGDPIARHTIYNKILKINKNINFPSIMHISSTIYDYNEIDVGTIICPNCSITTNINIGKFCIINNNTSIGHDSTISDFCTIAPNTTISGNTILNKFVDVGSGVITIPGVSIPVKSVVGAGAVVTKSFNEENSLIVGVPAVNKRSPVV